MKKKILILIDQPITKYFMKRIELKYLLNLRKVDVYIFNLLFFLIKKFIHIMMLITLNSQVLLKLRVIMIFLKILEK